MFLSCEDTLDDRVEIGALWCRHVRYNSHRLRLFEISVKLTSVNKSSPSLHISNITHLPPLLRSKIKELKVFNSLQLLPSPKLAI